MDALSRRGRVKRLSADLAAAGLVADAANRDVAPDLIAAVHAAADAMSSEPSVHAAICGNPKNALTRKLRWADMLRQAYAQGAERMVVLDAAAPDGVHADVDVKLGLFAAQLEVLDAFAALVGDEQLAEQAKAHMQQQALEAMAKTGTKGLGENGTVILTSEQLDDVAALIATARGLKSPD